MAERGCLERLDISRGQVLVLTAEVHHREPDGPDPR